MQSSTSPLIDKIVDFNTPTSFTGTCFKEGRPYLYRPYKNPCALNYLAKPVLFIARGAYAAGVVTFAAPIGTIYHLGASILLLGFSFRAEEGGKVRERSWQHLTAAVIDAKAFVTGIVLTPLAAAFVVVTINQAKNLEVVATLFGTLFSFACISLSPVFDYMYGPAATSNYLPTDVANYNIGRRYLRGLENIDPEDPIYEQIGRLQGLIHEVNRKINVPNFIASWDVKVYKDNPFDNHLSHLFEQYILILNSLAHRFSSSDKAVVVRVLKPHQKTLENLLASKFNVLLNDDLQNKAKALLDWIKNSQENYEMDDSAS